MTAVTPERTGSGPFPAVAQTDTGVAVVWSDGVRATFHSFWLRENCPCVHCRHPQAWERTVGLLDIPLEIQPQTVSADALGLHLLWSTGPACAGTTYSWSFLWKHRTETEARRSQKLLPTPWRPAMLDIESARFGWEDVSTSDRALEAALTSIETVGFTIIDDLPAERGSVLAMAERISHVQESHFGRSFEVESKHDPSNLAYTPRRLDPHNDLPSRAELPGVQLLHCLRNDAAGGESILVDALAVADRLRAEDPAAFELLSTLAVTYTSSGDDWEVSARKPVIELDEDGDLIGTCFHPALLGPVDVVPERMGDFYAAYRAMLSIAVDPAMQLSFRLQAGQCQIFHNKRILHARHSFDPSTGARHLHGCYVPLDDVRSRLAVLRRRGSEFRTA